MMGLGEERKGSGGGTRDSLEASRFAPDGIVHVVLESDQENMV